MQTIGIYIVSFVVGIFVGNAVLKKPNVLPKVTNIQQQTSSSSFSIEPPPSESLKGTISSRSGTLLWESRIATEPSELTANVPIQQGEEYITGKKSSATFQFATIGSITLSENTDISFIQTMPIDFVVKQNNGNVNYTINETAPLSIRIRNALITKTSGIIQITIKSDDPIITISTIKGTAQIGFNDLENVSQVFTLREGQIYEYDSDNHTAINAKNK